MKRLSDTVFGFKRCHMHKPCYTYICRKAIVMAVSLARYLTGTNRTSSSSNNNSPRMTSIAIPIIFNTVSNIDTMSSPYFYCGSATLIFSGNMQDSALPAGFDSAALPFEKRFYIISPGGVKDILKNGYNQLNCFAVPARNTNNIRHILFFL